jgi:hypothetical protein
MVANVACSKICDSDNGIVEWTTGGEKYTFWKDADVIKDKYIEKFLKDRFPGKLVVRELNKIDFTIPEDNLPIEVQATPVYDVYKNGNFNPGYSMFEKEIEKQINQNVTSYHMCWFFFDSELLRAMKGAGKGMSINMVWFRDHIKEGKLKVFTVSHDGIIEEKQYDDFNFLSKASQTCQMAAITDDMILNDNKLKIYTNVVKTYGFTQNDIDKFRDSWRECRKLNKFNSINKNDGFKDFLKKQKSERFKLYGNILKVIGTLPTVNDLLGLKKYDSRAKFYASVLGIFDVEGSTQNAITRFVDRPNICQYIPGYIRNKEMWDKLKGHNLNSRQFENIIKSGIGNYFWYEDDENSTMAEPGQTNVDTNCAENNDATNDIQEDRDKEVNFEIKSRGQIITVNIKKDETAGW